MIIKSVKIIIESTNDAGFPMTDELADPSLPPDMQPEEFQSLTEGMIDAYLIRYGKIEVSRQELKGKSNDFRPDKPTDYAG